MTVRVPCLTCGGVLTADEEDDLVTQVQTRVRDKHNGAHVPSRDHILAYLHDRYIEEG
jgi:hypothetical protein